MHIVDQQITSGGPRIYLSCFSLQYADMTRQIRDVYLLISIAFSLGDVLKCGAVPFLCRELPAITEVVYEVFYIFLKPLFCNC